MVRGGEEEESNVSKDSFRTNLHTHTHTSTCVFLQQRREMKEFKRVTNEEAEKI